MNTSEPLLQLDETAVTAAKSAVGAALPDVGTLTQMANEFFRSLPGQSSTMPGLNSFAGGAMPVVPGVSSGHLPQAGFPAPSLPSLPSVDKVPIAANSTRFEFADPSAAHTSASGGVSPPSEPLRAALPLQGFMPQAHSSPFSMPLPEFGAAFPHFESPMPGIPELPPLASPDATPYLQAGASQLYFMKHAGAMSKPQPKVFAPAQSSRFEPSLLPDIGPIRSHFDVTSIRADFPILKEEVNGHSLVWLDNAATTQKPQAVIDRISYFYEHENSNIHRAAHELAARATDAYEDARNKVQYFLNASSAKEIVFVRGATEAINFVAKSWGRKFIGKDDEIVVSQLEHHANIVPWQMLCAETGAKLRVIPVDDSGQILLDEYERLLNSRTKFVSFTQVSNALGTITPARQMVQMAHRYGARVLVDGAQAVSHMRVDVQSLDCDFYVFSGHKVFGPTGIGVVYGKQDVLAETPPWQGGGNMIVDVTFEKTIYQPPPGRFEAGTGNIADAVGLGAAIAYLDRIGMENISRHEHELLVYATRELLQIPGLCLIGTAKEKAGVMSFVLEGHRTEDVGAALNREGIAVRSGHHCAQPTLRRFGQETTVRPSLALYNNYEDIDRMIAALRRIKS